MPYYLPVNLRSMEPRESKGSGKATGELIMLGGEGEAVLPVFTSLARFWAFVDEYFAGDDSVRPSPFRMDPFKLAEVAEQVGAPGGFGFLVFNPTAVSAGQWNCVKKPIPVAHYCRFMSEIRPGIQEVVRESIARFGTAPPGFAADKEAMEWCRPRIEELSENAGARVDEWWDRHDA